MKKFLIGILVTIALIVGLASLAGLTPAYVMSAPGVATGIGSKLLCSSRYVSGFSQQQSFDDLVQYSGILEQLSVEFDDSRQAVTTSFFGLSEKTAVFLPNLGCGIDYAGFGQRAALQTQDIAANSGTWPAGDSVDTLDAEMQELVEQLLERDNRAGLNTRALLVAHRGSITAEAYAQGADAETPLLGWSMAKSLTAIMLANLEYRGLLDLDATTGFSEWQGDERATIRIRDMLTMSDGLDFSEQYNPGDDATAMLFTEPSSSEYVLAKPILHVPGSYFNYSSGTANLLARIAFDKAGGPQQNYDDFMANIYQPLAFQNAVFEVDASGVFMGSSYLYASAQDWARIGQLMLNGGTLNGQRIVREDWIARATTPNDSQNQKAYGYQWWLNRGNESLRWAALPADAFAAQGNRQQYLMIVPSLDLIIVRLGWTAGGYPVSDNFAEIANQLRGAP